MAKLLLTRSVSVHGDVEHVAHRRLELHDGPDIDIPSSRGSDRGDLFRALVRALSELVEPGPDSLVVVEDEDPGYCDECGTYTIDRWTVFRNGRAVIAFSYNNHLNGGDELDDVDALLVRTANALGHSLEIQRSETVAIDAGGGLD
jgi:hypothetical protein